jgi:excisionase family DNA binding protein
MTTECAEAELVSFAEASARLGLPQRTLRQRVADGSIDVYRDGRDHRRRLVRADDLAQLTQTTVIRERTATAV